MNEKEISSAYLESLVEELEAAGISPAPACPARPKEFGVTVLEYMEHENCTDGEARHTLNEAVKKGLMVSHKMKFGNGANPKVYCRPSEWPPKE